MTLNPLNTREFTTDLSRHHEFQKDYMLEKLVLLVVTYFTIATEMRLQVKENGEDKMF